MPSATAVSVRLSHRSVPTRTERSRHFVMEYNISIILPGPIQSIALEEKGKEAEARAYVAYNACAQLLVTRV